VNRICTTRQWQRKALPCLPAPAEGPRTEQFHNTPSIRHITRKARVSLAVAAVIAELCGFALESLS
jgi:hypothetical protein